MIKRMLAACAALIAIGLSAGAIAAAERPHPGAPASGPGLDRGDSRYARVGEPLLFGFADSSAINPFPGSPTPEQLASLEVAAGSRISRITIRWDRVEQNRPDASGTHSYDWSEYERQIEAFRAQGIGTLTAIVDAPGWAKSDSPACQSPHSTCPPDLAHVKDFGLFAQALVRRFEGRGLAGVEVWNEPNLELLWNTRTGPDPKRYADLFATARFAIRNANPTLPVIVGGLTVPPFNKDAKLDMELDDFLNEFYDAVPRNALDPAVGVAFHAYPGYNVGDTGGNNLFKEALRKTVTTTKRRDPGRALWATELGQSTTDPRGEEPPSERRQAQTIVRMIEKVDAQPRAVAALIYTVVERPPGNGQTGFGVVGRGPQFEPKRAYCRIAKERRMPKPAAC